MWLIGHSSIRKDYRWLQYMISVQGKAIILLHAAQAMSCPKYSSYDIVNVINVENVLTAHAKCYDFHKTQLL